MNNLTLGQKISAQRKLFGLSQEMLAEKMNVSRQAVSKWESDIAIPDVDRLILLARLFDVSVGWLLGVESSSSSDNTLSEEQLKAIEKMISGYVTRKIPVWRKIVLLICAASLLTFCFCLLASRITEIRENSMMQKAMIESLANENQQLNWQFQQLNDRLAEKMDEKLVLDKVRSVLYLSDQDGYVDIEMQLTPKVYQEANTAYIHIWNASNAYKEIVPCSYDQYNSIYCAKFTMPAMDGCEFRFMLVNDYGYEQEDLLLWDPGYAKLGAYSNFHLASECQVSDDLHADLASEPNYQTVYSFHYGIHTPHFFAKTAVAYKDISIELQINGEVIWRKSYLKAFEALMQGSRLNAADQVLVPDISVSLHQLNSMDEIKLVLLAETVNGGADAQKYEAVLDHHIVP